VSRGGNAIAQALIEEVLEVRPTFSWRGLGDIPWSALQLRARYASWDAERKFDAPAPTIADHPACACPDILRGAKKPRDCRVFGTACTPESPLGACMVSPEGSCAAYYQYGRLRKAEELVRKEVAT
jgi:hydrogenase expression/formation protein HypD